MENVSSLLSFFALYLFIYSYEGLTLYRNERASEGAVKPRGDRGGENVLLISPAPIP